MYQISKRYIQVLKVMFPPKFPPRGEGELGGVCGKVKCHPLFIKVAEISYTNHAVKVRIWDTLKSLSYLINCNSPPHGGVFGNVKCHPSFIKVAKKSYSNNAVKVWCSNVLKSLSYLINQNSPLRGGEGGGLFGRFKCCPKFINIVEKCFTNDAVKVRSWDTLKSLSYLINCNSPPMGGGQNYSGL